MSRIGKKPIAVPSGVTVKVARATVSVTGPKGTLEWTHADRIRVAVETPEGGSAAQVTVTPTSQEKAARALWGTTRALIANMVVGVTDGYSRKLEIYGAGYNCKLEGNGRELQLNVGFSGRGSDGKPQFAIAVPQGIEVEVETVAARSDADPARLTIKGMDKQKVGQFASELRAIRPPEPYKGKGIRYAGEAIRRKQGKAFAGGR